MKLSWNDNLKRCCIAVKEVSFRFVLLFRARLISIKSLILLPVFLPHLIFRFHVKTFEIQWVKNAQHSAPWVYHDNQENWWIPIKIQIKLLWFASFFDPLYVLTDNFLMSMSCGWWKWLQCVHVSCTFRHLTADCDGWEKTDPGDSLDGGEGEGWWHVCKQAIVPLRSWTNCWSKYEFQTSCLFLFSFPLGK